MSAAIEVHGLVKRWGSVLALDGLELAVPAGSIFGLIGPNGAGKTTAFSILCGFVRADAGEARTLGVPSSQVHALKGRLSALPQDALLPSHTPVLEALSFYGRLLGWDRARADDEARRALDRTGMAAWGGTRGGALSHGMAKRVGLAQAFLGSPEVVLLDEPTAGLDPVSAAALRDMIRSMRGTCTVLVSSHNLHELEELCDGAAIIARGRNVQSGTMAELTAAHAQVRFTLATDAPPLPLVAQLACVSAAEWDAERHLLVVRFEGAKLEAEEVIGQVLRVLLQSGVPISGVAKGRRLEERVLEASSATP